MLMEKKIKTKIMSSVMQSPEDYINFISHKPQKPTKFIFYKEHNIKLTDNAITKINGLRITNPNNIVRVMINGGGCQGFQYEFLTDSIAWIQASAWTVSLKTRITSFFKSVNLTCFSSSFTTLVD